MLTYHVCLFCLPFWVVSEFPLSASDEAHPHSLLMPFVSSAS